MKHRRLTRAEWEAKALESFEAAQWRRSMAQRSKDARDKASAKGGERASLVMRAKRIPVTLPKLNLPELEP